MKGETAPFVASLVTCTLACTGGVVQRFMRHGSVKGTSEDLRKMLTYLAETQLGFGSAKTLQVGDQRALKNSLVSSGSGTVANAVASGGLP